MEPDTLTPSEFCRLQRQLIERMKMRKKRAVEMAPMQDIKLQLLNHLESAEPEPALFPAALAEAVLTITGGLNTGPAQAVASDLQMDWHLACTSPGFVVWLRNAAAPRLKDKETEAPTPGP
jgi:hypothetical protein